MGSNDLWQIDRRAATQMVPNQRRQYSPYHRFFDKSKVLMGSDPVAKQEMIDLVTAQGRQRRADFGKQTMAEFDQKVAQYGSGVGASVAPGAAHLKASDLPNYQQTRSGAPGTPKEALVGFDMVALEQFSPRKFRRVAHELGTTEEILRQIMQARLQEAEQAVE